MNIFLDYQKKFLNCLNELNKKKIIECPDTIKNISVELPPKGHSADISCNAAMILAKYNKSSAQKLGFIIKEHFIKNFKEIEKIEVAKQGFINISFNIIFWKKNLLNIVKSKTNYGSNNEKSHKYNLEFVSANPTGPLHVGHCRGAILGDVLSNLLIFNGNSVTKEYYVNDHGSQIKNFVDSVYYRIIEIIDKKKFPNKVNLYPGDYIINIAKEIIKKKKIKDFSVLSKIHEKLTFESLKVSMKIIKDNLKLLGVEHDSFVYESELVKKKLVTKAIKKLEKDNFVYKGKLKAPKGESSVDWKSRSLLLFKSSSFGDDTDRSLQKEDGTWTYFASDVAYHDYKLNRKFDILINILGADHIGYIKRIVAATRALSKNKTNIICKVSQLVKLFKKGKPFKMSKRKGDYITVDDLISEVGKDSVRFMMLNRSNDVELDFDFEKVTEKSKDNPVYYVQYAFARINSIFNSIKLNIDNDIKISDKNFTLNHHEIQILKKISEWPKCVEISLSKLEAHRLPFYLYELATLFHAYWSMGNEDKKLRFVVDNEVVSHSRLLLLQALAIVIKNGMSILGVSTPKRM